MKILILPIFFFIFHDFSSNSFNFKASHIPSVLSSSDDLSNIEGFLYVSESYDDRLDIDEDNLMSRSKRFGVGGNVLRELDLFYKNLIERRKSKKKPKKLEQKCD